MQSRPWLWKVCAELLLLGAESGFWGFWRASLDSWKAWNLREEFSSQGTEQHLFLHLIVLIDNILQDKKKMCSVSNHYCLSRRAWFAQVNISYPLSHSWIFPHQADRCDTQSMGVQCWRPGWLPWHFSLDPVFTWCLSEHPLPILFPLPRPLWVLLVAMVAQALLHLHGHGRTGAEDLSLQAQGKDGEDMAWASVMPLSQMDVQLQPEFMGRWSMPWAAATGKQCYFSALSTGVWLCSDNISHQILKPWGYIAAEAGNSEHKVLTSSVWKHSYSQQKDSSA